MLPLYNPVAAFGKSADLTLSTGDSAGGIGRNGQSGWPVRPQIWSRLASGDGPAWRPARSQQLLTLLSQLTRVPNRFGNIFITSRRQCLVSVRCHGLGNECDNRQLIQGGRQRADPACGL